MTNLLSQAHLRGISSKALAAIASSALLLTLCTPPQQAAAQTKPAPDMIIFTNGDQLTGTLLRGLNDSIVFKSDMAGEITIPLSKVKELRAAGSFAVLKKGVPPTKAPVLTGAVQVGDGTVVISPAASATPQTIPDKDLAYIIDAATYNKELTGRDSFFKGWNGAVTAGATLIRATQTGTSFTAGVTASRNAPTVPYLPKRERTLFNLIESYGKLTQPVIPPTTPATPDNIAKTNIFHTDLEEDKYFTQHLYVLGTVAFDHNYSQGLNLQQIYGGGFGWTPLDTPRQRLDLTANIHYERQNFQVASSNQSLIGATVAEAYLRNLPGKLVFTESASFLPAFNNSNAYSANFAAGLALPVYHRLSVSFNTTDNYLNNPPPFFKKNSYQFVTGITYAFR